LNQAGRRISKWEDLNGKTLKSTRSTDSLTGMYRGWTGARSTAEIPAGAARWNWKSVQLSIRGFIRAGVPKASNDKGGI